MTAWSHPGRIPPDGNLGQGPAPGRDEDVPSGQGGAGPAGEVDGLAQVSSLTYRYGRPAPSGPVLSRRILAGQDTDGFHAVHADSLPPGRISVASRPIRVGVACPLDCPFARTSRQASYRAYMLARIRAHRNASRRMAVFLAWQDGTRRGRADPDSLAHG